MKRVNNVLVREWPPVRWHNAALIIGLALISTGVRNVWAQSSWTGYPNNGVISVISNGNVGINTASPYAPLDVKSANAPAIRVSGNTANNYLSIGNVDDGANYYTYFEQGSAANSPLIFYSPASVVSSK